MTETSSAAPKTRKTGPVKYEVYRVGEGNLQFLGPCEATNDIAAIKDVLGEQPVAGNYVAIAQHNIRVRAVAAETQVRLVIK